MKCETCKQDIRKCNICGKGVTSDFSGVVEFHLVILHPEEIKELESRGIMLCKKDLRNFLALLIDPDSAYRIFKEEKDFIKFLRNINPKWKKQPIEKLFNEIKKLTKVFDDCIRSDHDEIDNP